LQQKKFTKNTKYCFFYKIFFVYKLTVNFLNYFCIADSQFTIYQVNDYTATGLQILVTKNEDIVSATALSTSQSIFFSLGN